MKFLSVGVDLFHAGEQMGRHDEGNNRFSQFCERAYKLVHWEAVYTNETLLRPIRPCPSVSLTVFRHGRTKLSHYAYIP